MNKPNAPCLRCTVRTPGCHSSCDTYNFFLWEKEVYNEFTKARKKEENDVVGFKVNTVEKAKRVTGLR
ncbi:MAG: hypothetical protein RR237_01680 [Acetivibrio sp.]